MARIVILCGGVGGAKLAEGLQSCLPAGTLAIIANTGDDFIHRGLPICPDIDTLLYTLAGVANPVQGWGRNEESWQVQNEWRRVGEEIWFQLGDRDIALHLLRLELLSSGLRLTEVTQQLATRLGVSTCLLPMSDDPAPTVVLTEQGELPFREYFVKWQCKPRALGFRYSAAGPARPSPEVLSALQAPELAGIIIAPSNPFLSVAPILALPGLRDSLTSRGVPVIAVSPIVSGEAIKGPAAKIMRELGCEVTPIGVAREYRDIRHLMLIDDCDAALISAAAEQGFRFEAATTVMTSAEDRRRLAELCLARLKYHP
jgi:LPPG:FO 2-phospho-L-lactate transferase